MIKHKKHCGPTLFFLNLYSSFLVFGKYLITIQSLFGCLLSVGATLYTYYSTNSLEGWLGNQDFVLLGFAVVMPMSVSISTVFKRREEALRVIAMYRSTSYQIYFAHSCWDWRNTNNKEKLSGRAAKGDAKFWLRHSDTVLVELITIADELCFYLTLPTVSRARHRVTKSGMKEARGITKDAMRYFDDVLVYRVATLTLMTETLKEMGMPSNEASRVRQWERMLVEAIENLRNIKMYRSPQALRSFARLFSVFLPPIYAPTFAQLARDSNSLALGIAFSAITSIALTGLFEGIAVLEDPFVGRLTLDGIDIREEFNVLLYNELTKSRDVFFPDASEINIEEFRNESKSTGAMRSTPSLPIINRTSTFAEKSP